MYVTDAHSGVRQLIDGMATVVQALRYDAFGETTSQSGSGSNNVLNRGERFDSVIGQSYLRT